MAVQEEAEATPKDRIYMSLLRGMVPDLDEPSRTHLQAVKSWLSKASTRTKAQARARETLTEPEHPGFGQLVSPNQESAWLIT